MLATSTVGMISPRDFQHQRQPYLTVKTLALYVGWAHQPEIRSVGWVPAELSSELRDSQYNADGRGARESVVGGLPSSLYAKSNKTK